MCHIYTIEISSALEKDDIGRKMERIRDHYFKLAPLINEAFLCSRLRLLHISTASQNAKNKCLWDAQPQMIYLNAAHIPKVQGKLLEEKQRFKRVRIRILDVRLCPLHIT